MKYLSHFLALLSIMTVNVTMAQEVSVEEAQGRALNFLMSQTDGAKHIKGADAAPQVSLAYTSKSEGKTCFYVFNAGEDEGFVIIGGDEAAREILGYCDHGSFDYDTAPDNFKWWLSQYTGQIAHAAKVGVKGQRRAKGETTRVQIDPMIKTKWNQRSPYNNLIPNYNDSVYVTGCVATAMAQVMYYHKHPATTGSGSYGYEAKFRYRSQDGETVIESNDNIGPINFGATTYMWDKMKLDYKTDPNDTDDAVATLMFHAGVSVGMQYGTSSAGGSGALSELICKALATYFGYDKAMHMERRDYYNDEDWEKLVYSELEAGYPVFYSGRATNGGHQFICDGYDKQSEMFTFNWGWGGKCDGPYPLTGTNALLPSENGEGGAGVGSAYTGNQMIILGVKPNDNGNDVAHVGHRSDVGGMNLLVGNQTYEDTFEYERSNGALACYLRTSLFNISCLAEKLDFGVKAIKIKNADGSDVENEQTNYYKDRENINITIGSYYTQIQKLKFDPSSWEEGTYELQPVCRKYGQTDNDWQKVDILKDETYPTIVVKGSLPSTEGTIHFTERPSFNNDNNTFVGDLKMNFTIKNSTSNTTDVKIYCELTTETKLRSSTITLEDVLSGQDRKGSIDFASVFNDIDFEKEFKPNKKYTVKLFTDNNHTYYYNYPSVTFTYRATLNHGYRVSPAGYGTLILPFEAKLPEGMSLYSCSLVDSEDNLLLSKLETDVIERNKPYIVKADPDKTYPFEGPEAIDETHLFNDGVLYGAVADDVALIQNADYIMQYNSETNIAAFYLYNKDEGRNAAPYRAFLRLEGSSAKYAPPVFPSDEPESIEEIRMNHSIPAGIYSLDGKRQSELKKGLNVIILEDGTTKKVYVK
jgi:hypothetical protein